MTALRNALVPTAAKALPAAVIVALTVLALAATAFVSGPARANGSPVGTKVDGFLIGGQVCEGLRSTTGECYELLSLGHAALDRRLPGHPAVVQSGLYNWDVLHSETIDIAVFDLADGTRYAERVICSPSGCRHY